MYLRHTTVKKNGKRYTYWRLIGIERRPSLFEDEVPDEPIEVDLKRLRLGMLFELDYELLLYEVTTLQEIVQNRVFKRHPAEVPCLHGDFRSV